MIAPIMASAPLTRAARALPPTETAATAPVDTVEVSRPARPIFAEAAALGLMAGTASLNSPLSAVLSAAGQQDLVALLRDLEGAGLRFAHHPNPNASISMSTVKTADEVAQRILQSRGRFSDACLTVSRQPEPGRAVGFGDVDMNLARFTTFTDLQNVEAIAGGRDAERSSNPPLARALLALEDEGHRFFIDPNREKREPDSGAWVRRVGAYGAFRALTVDDGWGDGEALYAGTRFEGRSPVRGSDDLEALAYFSGASESLGHDARAVALRDIGKSGLTLHTSMSRPEPSGDVFGMSLRPPVDDEMSAAGAYRTGQGYVIAGVRGVARERVTLDQGPSADLRALAQWSQERLPASLPAVQAEQCVEAVALPMGRLPLAERARLLETLLVDCPAATAIDSARAVAETEDLAGSLHALLEMRKTMRPDVALDAWRHTRAEGRDGRLLSIAAQCDTFDEARKALGPISRIGFEEGVRIFGDLSAVHAGMGPSGRVDRALQDLDLLLAHRRPEQTVAEAAHTMLGLHHTVGLHGGWQASRDAFVFLQDGRFPRPAEETLQLFVSTFAHRRDVDAAKRAVLQTPQSHGRIEVSDGTVVIGGIRVSRRG